MRVGSLFSGIGGLDLGLARAGHEHVFFCESDPWRRSILARHWPGVPIYEDVADVSLPDAGGGFVHRGGGSSECDESERWRVRRAEAVDLLCGGFPCQDVSVAGRRAGLAGERSGLFHEFVRIADALRPGWLLIENVPGLLSSNGGRDFGVVLGTLADLGYGLAWRILDSRYFGVPQRRRRVFVLGAYAPDDPRGAAERCGQILAVGTRCERHTSARGEAREDSAVASLSGLGSGGPDDNDGQGGWLVGVHENLSGSVTVEDHARALRRGASNSYQFIAAPLSHGSNPNSNMAGRRRKDDENLVAVHMLQDQISDENVTPAWGKGTKSGSASIAVSNGASVRRLTPVECERLQAIPDGWTEPGADSRRYAALGDAVTASVAEWIGHQLMTYLKEGVET